VGIEKQKIKNQKENPENPENPEKCKS